MDKQLSDLRGVLVGRPISEAMPFPRQATNWTEEYNLWTAELDVLDVDGSWFERVPFFVNIDSLFMTTDTFSRLHGGANAEGELGLLDEAVTGVRKVILNSIILYAVPHGALTTRPSDNNDDMDVLKAVARSIRDSLSDDPQKDWKESLEDGLDALRVSFGVDRGPWEKCK